MYKDTKKRGSRSRLFRCKSGVLLRCCKYVAANLQKTARIVIVQL